MFAFGAAAGYFGLWPLLQKQFADQTVSKLLFAAYISFVALVCFAIFQPALFGLLAGSDQKLEAPGVDAKAESDTRFDESFLAGFSRLLFL